MSMSLRTRLAAWHTSVLALLLVSFATAAYAFVFYATRARTDASVGDAADELGRELIVERRNQATAAAAAEEVLSELQGRSTAFVVYDRAGRIVASRVPRPRQPAPAEETEPSFDAVAFGRTLRGHVVTHRSFVSTARSEGRYRVALVPVRLPDGLFIAAAAQSIEGDAELLRAARVAMLVAIPATLVLAWAGGALLARRSLAPMVAMRENADRISVTSLDDRLPIANPHDEVGQLAAVINELLARLERSFAQQRQFMADASHELRTPVAIIQNEASLAVSRGRAAAEYEDALLVVLTATRRLRRIVDDLFLLARADAGELPLRRDPVYLDEIVSSVAREVRSLAEARAVDVIIGPLPETPLVGDELLLHRLVLNLLDNAIKYSSTGARVAVRLDRRGNEYILEVEDTGPGVPAELQGRIFDRFVRADMARSHADDALTSGAGLGLSIAQWVAEAHGGTLELARSDETGTLFVLRLPAAASTEALLSSV
jgi:two-component system, OmpR family, sensor kinase